VQISNMVPARKPCGLADSEYKTIFNRPLEHPYLFPNLSLNKIKI
jgi:hypothetical protein